ncbi:MAG: hypothetical protein Q8M94_02505, partial [Ignavibacteria bacterium]|nr:hypothetical protein [Ignavibacteria bacterium]
MKTNIIFWLLFSCIISVFAQNRVLLKASGEIINSNEAPTSLDLKQEKKEKKINNANSLVRSVPGKEVNGQRDTLTYFGDGSANTNFGIFGQDWVLQWFIAP